jgi:hypothetical protein
VLELESVEATGQPALSVARQPEVSTAALLFRAALSSRSAL